MLQEKILPFVSVSEAVNLPEEAAQVDAVEAELAQLRMQQAGGEAELDLAARQQLEAGAPGGENASAEPGRNEAAVQVALPPVHAFAPWASLSPFKTRHVSV